MKKIYLLMVSVVLSLVLMGCDNKSNEYFIYDVAINEKEVKVSQLDDFLTNNDDYPNYNTLKENSPNLLEKVKNVTPNQLDDICQIYRFGYFETGGLGGETFLLYDDQFYQLGTANGGFGLTEFAYVNSKYENCLYYIYSFGSGVHRSHIGYFDFESFTNNELNLDNKDFITDDLQFSLSNNNSSLDVYSSNYTITNDEYFLVDKEKCDLLYKNIKKFHLEDISEYPFSKYEWENALDKRNLFAAFEDEFVLIGMKYETLKSYLSNPVREETICLETYPLQFGGYQSYYVLYEESEWKTFLVQFIINQNLEVTSYTHIVETI